MLATPSNATDGRTVGLGRAPVEMLDVGTVAEMLACSRRHVYRLVDAGRMPQPVKLGQLVRWRRAELVGWLEAGCPMVQNTKEVDQNA